MRVHMAILLLIHLVVSLAASAPVDKRGMDDVERRRRRQVLRQEKDTLLALKQGLKLPLAAAAALADWNESNGHVCAFTGVTCDMRREHVVGLDLADMGISGSIPFVIGDLSHLRSLDVSVNNLSGPVPASIGNLTRLRSLDVSYNSISGAIPPALTSLRQLQSLNISGNRFSGAVPPSIGNLTLLEVLVTASNTISGAIPPAICALAMLRYLDMSGNTISGPVPQCIGNLTRLEGLYVSDNLLSGAIPPSFGNLTSLYELDMSYNHLTGRIPAEIANPRTIEVLMLGNNQLHGGIPPSLSELTRMFYFNLQQNNLSGAIPDAIFLNCSRMGVVDLGYNSLSGEIPRAASALSTVGGWFAVLNVYSNMLTGTLPWWLANCSSLMTLDVENNSLDDELPTSIVSGKQYLKYLHLTNNNFANRDGDLDPFFTALSNCTCLQELEAGNVGMRGRLPSWLGSRLPPNMSHLNLELNAIEGPIPASIGDIINMTLMNLSSNLLNGTIPASICGLQRLERLVLSDNHLAGEIPACIGNATHLGELRLSGNELSGTIPSSIGSLTELRYLFLQGNTLSGAIPPSLWANPLLMLDLSSNSLAGVIPDAIASIAMLTLNLSRNQLGGRLPAGLSKMQFVETVDLSWNNFTGDIFTGIGDCVSLVVLDLSHNSLAGGLPPTLGRLRSLESLNVSSNDLSGGIPDTLTGCGSLEYLDLSYNDFSGSVPTGGRFANFSCLSYLGNPRLSGPVLRRCGGRRHRSWYQSRKFLVVLCVCAAALAFAVTVLCAVSVRKIRERLAAMREDMFRGRRSGGSSPVMKYKYPRITYRELVEATDDFSADRLVGTGSYGRVYRGTLRDGTMVAVKVLQLQTGNSTKSFSRECQVLKRIRHRNLMRIVTACSLPDFKALVLPFMANGSLERCLYAAAELSLVQRVNICSDIAEGMAYLHHHSPVKVIHCDLKPSNVLINDDMTALVSDFGISRLVMSTAGVANTADVGASTANMLCGSIGYIPPEYGYGSNPTTKGDVYSFGVLVMEMVTKKRPTDDMFEAGLSLHKWVKMHYHGRADAVVDPALVRMVRDQTPEVRRMWDVAIGELLELGILCTQEQAAARPTMMDAAGDLDRLKQYLGGDTTATFASSLGFSSTTFELEDID